MTPDALAALSTRAYRHMAPWSARGFAEVLASPHAVLTKTPYAFCLGRVVADEAEILALAADPDHQRQGEASKALAAFHAEAAQKGARRAFLEVAAANAPAQAFYAWHGYKEAGRRKAYYKAPDGTRDDALILSRALP